MQTLTLNIRRIVPAGDIRPGTAIHYQGRNVVVEEVRAGLDELRFMVRVPGHPRRRSLTVQPGGGIIVLPVADEVQRLVNALAVAHRGDIGDDWQYTVEAVPLDPEQASTVYDIYDTGGDVGIPETPLPADLLPRDITVRGNTSGVPADG
jgi:hypothetical protein